MGRRVRVVVAVLCLSAVATGCSRYNRRELVVHFAPGTSPATQVAARDACAHFPQATPEPLVTHGPASSRIYDIRYRVDNIDDGQLAALTGCLDKQPGVVGVDLPNDS